MVGAAFAVLLAAARLYGPPHRGPSPVAAAPLPIATPPGITLQLRAAAARARVAVAEEWVYADARGMTLYVYDNDRARAPSCAGECAAAWPAALAPPGARQNSDWSLLERADGTRQWAYRGSPLYAYSGDKAIGDALGDGAGGGAWHAAAFRPEAGMDLPDGIAVREIADAGGVGLVDSMGMTLYVFDADATHVEAACDTDCARLWVPLEAPAIANRAGLFTALARDDGITQWTHRGKPLYKFTGDRNPGDINGSRVDQRFTVALILGFFMPADVTIRATVELGNILATRGGATLYQRDRVTSEELHPFRTDHGSPALGRALGTLTCDANCTKTWPPLTAPDDALPCGFWDFATRSDGRRQWAYKGFALYTYAADKPGDIGGNAIYTLAQISGGETAAAAGATATADLDPNDFVGGSAHGLGLSALFWHAVVP